MHRACQVAQGKVICPGPEIQLHECITAPDMENHAFKYSCKLIAHNGLEPGISRFIEQRAYC